MSGRALRYFTQPMRSRFNVRWDANRRHPERSEAESKDPVEVAVGFATGFLDFARNDSKSHAQANSAGARG